MRATGIVRRIDELGLVVIPKEIRRTLRIREGDPSHRTFVAVTWLGAFCKMSERLERNTKILLPIIHNHKVDLLQNKFNQ